MPINPEVQHPEQPEPEPNKQAHNPVRRWLRTKRVWCRAVDTAALTKSTVAYAGHAR
jgi:hypothetical protein